MVYQTIYISTMAGLVKQMGGAINFHTHLDRAGTLDKKYLEHAGMDPMQASAYPLGVKQNLTGELHKGPAYKPGDLKERMTRFLTVMADEFNTKQVFSLIDTTADIGTVAFETALEVKKEIADKIDFRVGSYPIFGFKDNEPGRWKIFEQASREADFLGALPERDDKQGHVGYKEHLRRILCLAAELEKPVHVHVDQANDPGESGTEELVHAVDYCVPPEKRHKDGRPMVWAVHSISPSAYDDKRFKDMLDGMRETRIGVICCPTAAISMKQKRVIFAPTHNSIARVCEMLVKRIPVGIGSDNIEDVFVPTGSPDIYGEAARLSDYTRFYGPEVWAKVLAGQELNEMDLHSISKAINGEGD